MIVRLRVNPRSGCTYGNLSASGVTIGQPNRYGENNCITAHPVLAGNIDKIGIIVREIKQNRDFVDTTFTEKLRVPHTRELRPAGWTPRWLMLRDPPISSVLLSRASLAKPAKSSQRFQKTIRECGCRD
jgi:hypothetical protein